MLWMLCRCCSCVVVGGKSVVLGLAMSAYIKCRRRCHHDPTSTLGRISPYPLRPNKYIGMDIAILVSCLNPFLDPHSCTCYYASFASVHERER